MRQKDSGIVRSRQGKSVFEGTVRGFRKVGSDENPGERDAQVRGRPRLDLLVDLMFLNHCCPLVADARARPGETMCLRTQIPVMPSTRQRAQTGPVQIGERFRGGVQAACIRLRSSYFGRVKGRRISTTLRLMLAMARPGSISTGSAIVRKRTFQWLRLFLRMNAPLLGLFFVTDRFSLMVKKVARRAEVKGHRHRFGVSGVLLIEAADNPRPVHKLCQQTQDPKQDHHLASPRARPESLPALSFGASQQVVQKQEEK